MRQVESRDWARVARQGHIGWGVKRMARLGKECEDRQGEVADCSSRQETAA